MSFVAPFLLIGLLAVAIPPIIHLIHKRKAEVVKFPALEFIKRSQKKTSRQFRVRQFLLMLMRSLLLAAVAFAVARPFIDHTGTTTTSLTSMRGATVFVVDASWSMAWRGDDGERLFDKARFQVEALLGSLDGQAAVVIAHDRVEVPFSETTRDFESIKKALEDLSPSPRTGLLGEAVARAYELLNDVEGEGRRVVVLTTPAGAASALPQPPAASGVELVPVDVADGAPLPNRAVLDVRLRPAPELGAGQWRIDARVGNFGTEAVARLPVHLEVGDQVVVRGFLDLPAGAEATKTFYATLDRPEATPAAVVIEADHLTDDDRRAFWLQPAPRVRVLAVNGDPKPTPYLDELFYFERAVSPRTASDARVELTITAPDTVHRHDLGDFDVVLLANVAEVQPALARAFEAFVRGGGGLWITLGDQVKRANWNVAMRTLLPRTLRDVRQAGDAAANAESGDRQLARLGLFERGHPILRPFADPATSSLSRVQVRRYMLLDPAPDAGGDVVLGLDEGAPYLLTKRLDEGRIALLTGTLDRDWGDLPIRPDFVPLMQTTLRYLTRVADVDTTPVLVGRSAAVPAEDARVRRVRVVTPAGELHTVDRPRDVETPWTFEKTTRPGHYTVQPDPPLPGLPTLPGFAVALDPAGSDLRGPAVTSTAKTEGADDVRAALAGGRTELWHAALLGLFGFLLAEGLLLFRKRRERLDAFNEA